jgi:hypothetical protein
VATAIHPAVLKLNLGSYGHTRAATVLHRLLVERSTVRYEARDWKLHVKPVTWSVQRCRDWEISSPRPQ